ncbi:MAG: tetratricopeptide repeat protein [Melioribacteraceae bacterium]|nr:tetratricopeptide repeat protein [Melioribacteraceae bacterium]
MKTIRLILVSLSVVIFLGVNSAKISAKHTSETVVSDSLLMKFSLFWEAYKNKDYQFAYPHLWDVINNNPSGFIQYKPFRKMEDMILYFKDSTDASPEQIKMYVDTLLAMYDIALEKGAKNPEYFIIKKAYAIETMTDASVEEVVAAYEYALSNYPDAPSYYKDRLGIIYTENDDGANGYKEKALELYSSLAEQDPENDLWNQRMKSIAEDPEELASIMKKSWDLDPDNLGKAYAYAETCYNYQFYEQSLEPLKFLTEKAPDVINYWRKLASVYTKLEQNDNAINAYKTLIELEPNNRENYYNIAVIYQKLGQLSVARSYLQKASSASEEPWDLPLYVEAQLYEQAARDCGFEFEDKLVYQLAVDTYKKAAALNGPQLSYARERIRALENSVPQQEDYFFRNIKSGTVIKIEGKCYGWINRSITVP